MTAQPQKSDRLISFRRYLIIKAMARAGAYWPATVDAVTYAEQHHPEWDFEQLESWETWEEVIYG